MASSESDDVADALFESADNALGSRDSEASADESQSETLSDDDDDPGAERALESEKPFPKDVTEKLEALYCRGMDGWGKAHKSEIDVAMTSTGLKLSQIKVSCSSYWPGIPWEACINLITLLQQ